MDPEDFDEGSDVGEETEEDNVQQKPGVDYEVLDPETGFKAVEWKTWQAFSKAILSQPEDEREGEEEWAETFAEENQLDKNRVLTVVKLGIYAGDRDEFNQRTGEGKTIHPNSDVYTGQYWEGKRNGKGKYEFRSKGMGEVSKLLSQMYASKSADEDDASFVQRASKHLSVGEHIVEVAIQHGFFPSYNGMYVNDMRHGFGVSVNKDATCYEGHWKNNKRHGEGVYYYLNGDTYQGQWEDGKKTGCGSYTFSQNRGQYVGVWQENKFVEGQWRMSDGTIFEGKFDAKNQPFDDNAAIKFPSLDMVVCGQFAKGQWTPLKGMFTSEQYSSLVSQPVATDAPLE